MKSVVCKASLSTFLHLLLGAKGAQFLCFRSVAGLQGMWSAERGAVLCLIAAILWSHSCLILDSERATWHFAPFCALERCIGVCR